MINYDIEYLHGLSSYVWLQDVALTVQHIAGSHHLGTEVEIQPVYMTIRIINIDICATVKTQFMWWGHGIAS